MMHGNLQSLVGNKRKETGATTSHPRKQKFTNGNLICCTLPMQNFNKIFVKNVDPQATERELGNFFRKFGRVMQVRRGYKNKTTALVTFAKEVDIRLVHEALPDNLWFKEQRLCVQKPGGKKFSNESRGNSCAAMWTINSLPNEILVFIFSFLSIGERIRTKLVCKRWQAIGKKLIWSALTKLKLPFNQNPLNDCLVLYMLSHCGNGLKQLEISCTDSTLNPSCFTSNVLVIIGKYCPNLTSVKLINLPASWYLGPLARGCPKLKQLRIYGGDSSDDCLSDFVTKRECASSSHHETVELLELKMNTTIDGKCFNKIGKNLSVLRLVKCTGVQPEIALQNLMKCCGNIRELFLIHCCKMEPNLLSEVLNCYKAILKVLHLDGHEFKSSQWIESLSLLWFIEELSLEQCRGINDDVLKALAKICNNLTSLNVSETFITDAGVSFLASAPHLKVLDISYTKQVTGKGIKNLATQGRIEELYVKAIRKHSNKVQESCVSLTKLCCNLRILDVTATRNINGELVNEFHTAIRRGYFKAPVCLYVGFTEVDAYLAQEDEKLKLFFHNTFRKYF